MYVFGINLPLMEILFVLIFIFVIAIIYFAVHLKKLEQMSKEEIGEIQELQEAAVEDKRIEEDLSKQLTKLEGVEAEEQTDLKKMNDDVGVLEESTETIYLKKLVPDVYKLQNYILWALKKGIQPDTVKENLIQKGWKDTELIDMVIADMDRYVRYYKDKKGVSPIPEIKIEQRTRLVQPEQRRAEEKPSEDIETSPPPELPLPAKVKLPRAKKVKSPEGKAKKAQKKKAPLGSVESEIKKLEADLKKAKPKPAVKSAKPSPKKKAPAPKKSDTGKGKKAAGGKEDPKSVISLEGKKDFDIDIKIK